MLIQKVTTITALAVKIQGSKFDIVSLTVSNGPWATAGGGGSGGQFSFIWELRELETGTRDCSGLYACAVRSEN